MRIIRYHQHGTPEVPQVDEVEKPEPGPGQVRIRAEAIGVNFAGLQERAGEFYYGEGVALPACPGGDAVWTTSRPTWAGDLSMVAWAASISLGESRPPAATTPRCTEAPP